MHPVVILQEVCQISLEKHLLLSFEFYVPFLFPLFPLLMIFVKIAMEKFLVFKRFCFVFSL